jgi:glycosyltransferase involved in cell wall biosynthesis
VKVLFVCPFVPWPLDSGGKIRTFHLLKEASQHAEVHLRVIQEREPVPDAREALAPHAASVELFERARPGPLARWSQPKLERWSHAPALIRSVRAELAVGGFHLVHLDELLLARIVPVRSAVPVVQHHHKLDTVLYGALAPDRGLARRFDLWKLRKLEVESTRRYRHHILCSAEDAEILRSRYGALDCSVVPSGYDPSTFTPTGTVAARSPELLVFVGSMDYGPNVEAMGHFVREVLPLIAAEQPRVRLQIVGSRPDSAVQALASDRVEVVGRVDDVRPFLERASALVVPLRIGGGTRLKIVEALALGTPVVSTTIGAEGLGLSSGKDLLKADGARAFAEATLQLLRDPDAAARLGRAGRSHVKEHLSWQVVATDLVDIWERVAIAGRISPSR